MFLRVLKQILVEREGLSARCLKPRDFNGFEPADFVVCTSRVYQCRALALSSVPWLRCWRTPESELLKEKHRLNEHAVDAICSLDNQFSGVPLRLEACCFAVTPNAQVDAIVADVQLV